MKKELLRRDKQTFYWTTCLDKVQTEMTIDLATVFVLLSGGAVMLLWGPKCQKK